MKAKISVMGVLCLINKLLNKRKALLIITFLLCALGLNAQQTSAIQIKGTVVSAVDGLPLIGATIKIKNTNQAAKTNRNGAFSIASDKKEGVLQVSFLGFKSQEFPFNHASSAISISLEEDSGALEEVEINAGYYSVKDRDRTGSISRITSEEISKQPIKNPLEAMIGRMPGVFIEQGSGIPGAGFNIQIRGKNSISSGNRPLYILDGVPFPSQTVNNSIGTSIMLTSSERGNPLDGINPADIESIEVLKDADATAIYGSRGSNGVVLITTKKGKSGSPSLQVGMNTGFGKVANKLELLNTEQWLEMRKQAFINDGVTPNVSNAPDLMEWDPTRYTDWHDVFIGGTARNNRFNTSLSGGNNNTNFLLSGNYMDEQSVFPTDDIYKKYGALFNVNHKSDDGRLNIGVSLNAVGSDNNLPTDDFTAYVITTPPVAPKVYNDDGSLSWENYNTMLNPMAITGQSYRHRNTNINTQLNISYRIIEGLKFKVAGGYNGLMTDEIVKRPASATHPILNIKTSDALYGKGKTSTYSIEPQLFYDKYVFGGQLSALIGGTYQETDRKMESFSAEGFTNESQLDNMLFAPTLRISSASGTEYRYVAAFGRLNYKYKDRYIINLTARRDGSSRFGAERQFANFGAMGVAYLFTEENWVKENLSFLSFGKLRGSYGITGNDQIADYGFMHTYSATDRKLLNEIGMLPNRHANPDYSWETNRKLEAAIEMRFIDHRIGLNVSWYRNRSSNQLLGYPLSGVTGQQSVQRNLDAEIQNKGWEFEFLSQNIKTKDFNWNTSFNISIPSDKLLAYPNLETSSHRNAYVIGQSMNRSKGYIFIGVDPNTGTYQFKQDENGNSVSEFLDFGMKFYAGLQNTVEFRSLQLSVFLQFTKKDGYSYLNSFSNPPGSIANNQLASILDGENNRFLGKLTRFSNSNYTEFKNSNIGIANASYIRFKNIALSYYLPKSWIRSSSLKDIRLSMEAQNVATWTTYMGLDPENANSRVLPPLKMINLGVQIQF